MTFPQLKPASTGRYKKAELDMVIEQSKPTTPQIVDQIIHLAQDKLSIMVFAATVRHAQDLQLIARREASIVIGDTPTLEHVTIISDFKSVNQFAVNVSVLTTGFDHHVDLIAVTPDRIHRLYQQIVGATPISREKECLVLDYAGNS